MPIVSYVRRLSDILSRLRNGRLQIPRHQREFCWTPPQMKGLVDTVKEGLPMPAILVREYDDGSQSLEDGRQRLETLRRYVDGIPHPVDRPFGGNDGRLFAELSEAEQANFLAYEVVVVCYSGLGDAEARRIFTYYQGGRPLTIGERLWTFALTSPVVEFAIQTLLTPAGLGARLAPMLGEHEARGARGKDLTTAVALCAGLAFRIDRLSRKWDDLEAVLHLDIDADLLSRRLETYARVWERVHELEPVTTQARRKKYWDLGNFGGYIAYSILLLGTAEARPYNLPATEDALVEAWAQHVVSEYRLESRDRVPILHRDLSRARSWKLARWQNGLRLLFTDEPAVDVDGDGDGGEDTEDEASD